MGDMAEAYRLLRDLSKKKKVQRMEDAQSILPLLTRVTEYHYYTMIDTKRVDFWPSTGKWRYDGRTYIGKPTMLISFLKKRGWIVS